MLMMARFLQQRGQRLLRRPGFNVLFVPPQRFPPPNAKIQLSFGLSPQLFSHQEQFGVFYGPRPPGLSWCPPTLWTETYPFARVSHLLPLGAVQRVVVVAGAAAVQVDQHGVGVLHGCQRALGHALVDGLVDGDDGCVH